MPANNSLAEASVYEKVANTPAEQLEKGVVRTDGYTDKDKEIAHKDKEDDYNIRKTWKKVKCYAVWASAIFLGLLLFTLCISCVFLIAAYVHEISNDAVAIRDLFSHFIEAVLTVLATLFIEHQIKNKSE